jgi:hypothetical protein
MTVVDKLNVASSAPNSIVWQPVTARGWPHISVCWEIDINRWKELLFSTLH